MATQQTKDGLGYIIQAISNIVEPKMETLKYDKTYRAKIVEEIEVGIYKVQINNVIYKLSYSGALNVGDIVRVKAPLNNFSDIYIEPLPGSGGESGGTTNYNDLANKPVINSTYSTSQTTNANETLKGTIALHKISKTGNYNDLLNKPNLNFIPTSQKGAADGVASLGADKIVPKSELPTDVVYDSNYKHITIENVLNSTSTTNALSANQGKVLNDKINALKIPSVIDNLTSTSTIDALSANQGKVLAGRISDNDTMITNLQEDIILAEDNIAKIKKDYIPLTQKGYANGVAALDANMKLIVSQLPIATKTSLGAIKIGDNLSISEDGTLNAAGTGGDITNQLLEKVYPVGSIYISANRVSPQVFLGGTWEPFAYGRTLVGVDDSDSSPDMDFAEPLKTGGEKTHQLTIEEMPSHNHSIKKQVDNNSGNKVSVGSGSASLFYQLNDTVETNNTGGGQAHNNMQPYITVYMWRRIS